MTPAPLRLQQIEIHFAAAQYDARHRGGLEIVDVVAVDVVEVAFGGVIIAVLVATPEAIGAVRAALANHMQRSVNIFLGSVLATIGLTVPSIIVVSRLTGHDIVLGVEHTDLVMLALTLFLCVVTFASGRTNVIQGAVHVVLFAVYLALIVQS